LGESERFALRTRLCESPVDSSAEGEGITTSKCAELTVFIREVARGMGILDDKPTVIRSDNASSVRVANDPKAAGRLRHAMRRYAVLQEHVKQGVVRVEFIRDANNAADFLTKWVPAAKLKASIAYVSNQAAKPKKQGKTASRGCRRRDLPRSRSCTPRRNSARAPP
jgi:PAS domain-containing protein